MQTPENYDAAIDRMKQRMAEWRKAHPDQTAQVAFRNNVMVIGTVRDAVEMHLIQVNREGYDMLRFMCEPEGDKEPTVIILRLAMEDFE